MIFKFFRVGFLILTLGYSIGILAKTDVKNVRIWASPDNTRVVLDLSEKANYKYFTLDNPSRLVIDLENASWSAKLNDLSYKDTPINIVRQSKYNKKDIRFVIELSEIVTSDVFLLAPNKTYGHRLVIDLESDLLNALLKPNKENTVILTKEVNDRDYVIAIDAGHGGEDPGAIGQHYQTKEKDIVLSVAKKLAKRIDQEPGMRAVLIREGDYYIALRKRIELARKYNSDLFISIHADSFINTTASGASTYVLSQGGASSEAARWLAEKENQSDLIGGLSLNDKGNLLASVLLDLSQTANQSASESLAKNLLKNLGEVGGLHSSTIQYAGFAVLKSPDIPSVLVELGFISNKEGERNLRQPNYQQKLAHSIFSGIKQFIAVQPPTFQSRLMVSVEEKRYTVQKGDTLSEIAKKHGISQEDIKKHNNLEEDKIIISQVLLIPPTIERG